MGTVLEFLKKHWRLFAVIAALFLAFAFGRFSAGGAQIVETEKVVEVKVIDEVATETEVDRRVKEIQAHMETKTVTVWVEKPDGTKTKTETKEVKTDTTTKEVEVKTKEVEVVKKEYIDRVVEKEKIITPPSANYKVGLFIGTELLMNNYQPEFARTPVLVGVSASRKLFGPVWLDATLFVGIQPIGVTQLNAVGLTLGASAQF